MKSWLRRREAGPVAARERTAAAGKSPRWSPPWYGVLLASLPLVQAALDRRWLFDGFGRDPWIYYGYFRFARVYLKEAWDAYYSSRLSVILPGYAVRELLPAVPANLVLHLGLYACAIAAFYGSTRIYSGRRGALLASLVLGCQPFFLQAIGSNYVPGFGLTYYLLALAAVAVAASRPAGRTAGILLAMAGAAAVAVVAANLFYALYLPLLAAHYLVLNHLGGRQRLLPAALWAAGGGAAAFAALDAAGWLWGHGSKLFLKPTIAWLWSFSQQPSIFKHPLADWGPRAIWLVFPAIVLAGSLAVLARRSWARHLPTASAVPGGGTAGAGDGDAASVATGEPSRRLPGDGDGGGAAGVRAFAQLQYLALFAMLAAFELEPHGVTLEYFYYAVLLLPPACLALACQLAPIVDRLTPRVFGGLAVGTAAVLAPAGLALPQPWAAGTIPSIALPLAAGAVAVAVVAAGWRGLRPASLVVASLLASLLLTNNLSQSASHSGYDDSFRFFRQVDGTLSRLQAADPSLRLRLWYSMDEEDGYFYDSLACAWRLCARLVTFKFPDVAGGRMCGGQRMVPGTKVAVLSQRLPPAAAAAADRSLESIGLRARWLGASSIPGPVKPISLLIFEAAALPSAAGSGDAPDALKVGRPAPPR